MEEHEDYTRINAEFEKIVIQNGQKPKDALRLIRTQSEESKELADTEVDDGLNVPAP